MARRSTASGYPSPFLACPKPWFRDSASPQGEGVLKYLRAHKRRALLLALTLAFLTTLAVPPALMQDVSFSRAVYDRRGELLRLTTSEDEKFRLFAPLESISPTLVEAVLLHEDRHFHAHPGINPVSLAQAAMRRISGGRGGASTLTMQLARLKHGIPTGSFPGKLWQMAEALRLELHYSKHDILEAYLNLAPYGGNIEGVGAASHIYFNRPADALSLPEALTLAVIPQSPAARAPGKSEKTEAALIAARSRLFARWAETHKEDAHFATLLTKPMRYGTRKELPFEAPQFAARMLRQQQSRAVTTTLDANLQRLTARLVARYAKSNQSLGIANASALLIDTRDMSVLASVGSADYFDRERQGMIDGTRARRSPGSALKPFIYALAFDQGIIHPMSLLKDSPLAYATYTPENFDRDFLGPLSAHDALIRSRNIPALALAEQLSNPDLYAFLKASGIGRMKPKEKYGLSLVLGGAEVTMEELVNLYAMLASDGMLRPIRRQPADAAEPGTRLLSPEAAFMTLDILKDTPPPGGSALSDALPLPVYWKTGTSNGLRDAWSVGVFGPYALAVWTGDFKGGTRGQVVGIASAAPLFFDIVRAVHAREHPEDQLQPKAASLNLSRSIACSDTGDIANPYCPARESVWLIPGTSPIKPTNIYRRLLVNKQTGKLACRFTDGKTDYRVLQFWPSELTDVFTLAGIHKSPPPAWEDDCAQASAQTATPPRIVSPSKASFYRVRADADNRLPLKAALDGSAHAAFWFVGDQPLGRANPGETLFWAMTRGKHVIRVVDDAGNADSRMVSVE